MDRRGDELLRWSSERAPELIAEAEREAVRVLRDALVDAATRAVERETGGAVEPPGTRGTDRTGGADPAAEAPASGELLWAYCVMRPGHAELLEMTGVDGSAPVEREEAGGLVALVSRVPASEFAAEALRRNLNDLTWLERVARAHEAVLEAVLEQATIVPLRMCTLYERPETVRAMLTRERDSLADSLAALDGRLEWAVKVTVDRERLLDHARADSDIAAGEDASSRARGEGGAYMLRRRRDREVRELAQSLAADVSEQVHARLQDWAIDAVTRPPQNPELSGHEGQMILNAAYLVERTRVGELRRLVNDLEARYRELGARIELTGPWPPYNFVTGGDAASPA